MKKTLSTAAVAAVFTTIMLGAGAQSAQADVCNDMPNEIATTNVQRTYVPGANRASGSPGGTVSIQRGETSTTTGTLSGSVTAEAGAIFASASVTAGVSISQAGSVSTTTGYSVVIPPEGGYLELGSEGRSFDYTVTRILPNCTRVPVSGAGTGSTSTPYFYTSWVGFV